MSKKKETVIEEVKTVFPYQFVSGGVALTAYSVYELVKNNDLTWEDVLLIAACLAIGAIANWVKYHFEKK